MKRGRTPEPRGPVEPGAVPRLAKPFKPLKPAEENGTVMDLEDFPEDWDTLPDPDRDRAVAALRSLGYAGEPRVGVVVADAMRHGKRLRTRRLSVGASVLAVVAVAAGGAYTAGRTDAAGRVHPDHGASPLTRMLAQRIAKLLPGADVREVRLPAHAAVESAAVVVQVGSATAYVALTDQRWYVSAPRDTCPDAAHRPPPDCGDQNLGDGTTTMTFSGRPGARNARGVDITHVTGVRVTLTETAGGTAGTVPDAPSELTAPLPLAPGQLVDLALDPGWNRLAHLVNLPRPQLATPPIVAMARELVPAGWTDTTPSGPSEQRSLRNAQGTEVTLTFHKAYDGALYFETLPSQDYCFTGSLPNCVVSTLPDGRQLLTFHFSNEGVSTWATEVRDPVDDSLVLTDEQYTGTPAEPPIPVADIAAMAADPRWAAVH